MCVQISTIEGWRVFNLSSRRAVVHLEASHASICNLSSRQTTYKDYFHQLAQILLSLIVWKEHKLYNWVNTPDNPEWPVRKTTVLAADKATNPAGTPICRVFLCQKRCRGKKEACIVCVRCIFEILQKVKKAAQTSVGSRTWREIEPDASAFVYSFKIRP